MLLWTTCKRPRPKKVNGSLCILKSLSKSHSTIFTKMQNPHSLALKSGSFFKRCVSFGNGCMSGQLGIIFYFCTVIVNYLLKIPPKNIKRFENDNHISETMSGDLTGKPQISDSSEMTQTGAF